MIIPTLPFQIHLSDGFDVFGQPKLRRPIEERCCPVRLDFETQNTTVRTDSAASHGHAHEDVAKVVILVLAKSKAAVKDTVLTILGNKLRVTKVHPRYTVGGKLDHFQLECAQWA